MRASLWIPVILWGVSTSCTCTRSSELQWSHSAGEISHQCKKACETLMAQLNYISQSESSDFQSTVIPIETALAEFANKVDPLTFYGSVGTEKEVREAGVNCEKQTSKLQLEVFMREDLYRVVKRTEVFNDSLKAEDRQLLQEYLRNFRENGLGLVPADKARLESLRKELITLETEFQETLNNWNEVLHLSKAELMGLPSSIVQRLQKSNEPGKDYILTLKYPDYIPAMEYLSDANVRQLLFAKFRSRGGLANKERLQKTIKLRYEIAKLLGHKTYAELKLQDKMAKSPEQVQVFLKKLQERLRVKSTDEINVLLDLKRAEGNDPTISRLEEWDFFYYDRKLQESKYQLDPELVRTYFPLSHVIDSMFAIYQQLLGVRFQEIKGESLWQNDVRHYAILEPKTGKPIASFYLDLFPREGKYGHAAAFTLIHGFREPLGDYVQPVSAIVTNFNPPQEGRPSLLTHKEVETLFHEFGHIMHQTLTTTRYASLSGTRVKRDFVEAPSQMLENWLWQKEPLLQLSSHYETGEKLPAELLQKILAAKKLNQGLHYLKQVFFASIDLAYHTLTTFEALDTTRLFHSKYEEVVGLPAALQTTPEASFAHIMGGYDAGYYGYLWSEVFAADMFTLFEANGLFDAEIGARYRKWILEPGGSRDPNELIAGFLSRSPSEEAFLKQFE